MFINYIKSLFGANTGANATFTTEQLQQAVAELFYHSNAFDLGQVVGQDATTTPVKATRARIFVAGFTEALKHVDSTESVIDIASKIHDAMIATWRTVLQPSEIYDAMKQEFDYRVGPYSALESKPARAEPIFILLALRELAKATPNDVSTDTLADRADALMLATYRSMGQ
jgi:hypothetical protein